MASFKLPSPVRPLYVWGGYIGIAIVLALVSGQAQWAANVMGLYFLWAIFETVRFYRHRRASKASEPQSPFKSDFVRARQQPAAAPVRGDFNDEYVQGETIWTGSKQIRFAYRTSDGDYSDREVTVHKVVSSGSGWSDDIYFVGFCHLRGEPRTFRLDRVRYRNKVVDTATGEVGTLRQILGVKRRVSR